MEDRRITQVEYEKRRAKWRAEQKQHECKLSKLSQADEQYYVTVPYLLQITSRGNELFEDAEPAEKRELICLLGSNLFLDGKKVKITLYVPCNSIASRNEHSVWLRGLDSNQQPMR